MKRMIYHRYPDRGTGVSCLTAQQPAPGEKAGDSATRAGATEGAADGAGRQIGGRICRPSSR